MSKIPFQITAAKVGKVAEIRIVGYIGWSVDAESFRREVDALVADGCTEAHLYINSGGGSCFDAEEIVNILHNAFGDRITGEGGAIVASEVQLPTSPPDVSGLRCQRMVNLWFIDLRPM